MISKTPLGELKTLAAAVKEWAAVRRASVPLTNWARIDSDNILLAYVEEFEKAEAEAEFLEDRSAGTGGAAAQDPAR